MKTKLLKLCTLLCLLCIGGGNVWGEDITFNPASDKSFPKDGITLSVTDGTLTNGTDYRVYKNQTLTISSTVGNITNIALTYSSASYDGGGWAASYQPNATSWTSPTANGEQARITKLVVTVSSGGTVPTTYTVTVANDIANGTVTANPTSAAADTEITLTATPATGYKFGSWDVTNASTNDAIAVTNNKFTMPAANVNVSAKFNKTQGGGDDSGNHETTGTITFGTNNVKIDKAIVEGKDNLDNTWTITTEGTNSYTANPSYYQVGKSALPAKSITFTTTLPDNVNISKMSAKFGGFSGTAGTVTLMVGEITIGTGSLNETNDVNVNSISTASGKVLTVSVTGIEKGVKVYNISYTYTTEDGDGSAPDKNLIGIEATGTPAEFWKGDAFNHNGITITALWYDEDEEDVTSSCEFSGYDMSTAGQQTVTVTFKGETCQYGIEVKTIANTQAEAYTVAQAKALIDAGKDLATLVYVKGTVSEIVTAWSDQYNNITYNISDDGQTTGTQFQLFRCVTNGAAVGDDVVAYGTLTKYNEIYEFAAGNNIENIEKLATLSIADIAVANGEDITPVITTNVTGEYAIEYTSNNEEVVLADGDEMVTMGAGTATITATLVADGYKTVETTFNVTVTTNATLTSVTLSGELANTTYTIGDAFDHTGLVATAIYSDDTQVDVTETATWEVDPETLTTAGTVTVTVSASFGGQEDIQEYDVTVNKKTATISFASETFDVEAGKTLALAPETTPFDAEISYTIIEGNSCVSLENGVVTGVAEGTATIRVDYAGNAEYAAASTTVTINVIPADPSTIVTYNFSQFTSGQSVELTDLDGFVITLKGNGGTNPAWSSNQARVYAKGSLTVKAKNATIKSIEYDYVVNANSKGKTPTIDEVAGTTSTGNWDTENKTWTGADEEVTFSTSGDAGNIGFTKLVIKYVESGMIATSLAWSKDAAEVTIDANDNVFPTLTTTPVDLDGVTYESSNPEVASIAADGSISLLTAGETTITANYAGDAEHKPAESVSYTLTVKKAPFVPTPVAEGYETVDFTKIEPYKSLATNGSSDMTTYEGNSFSVEFAKKAGTNNAPKFYQNGNAVRCYVDNTITITGAEPIADLDIAWVDSYVDDAVSITGLGTTTAVVTFSKTCRFTAISVDYRSTTIITIASACTDGEKCYSTYSNAKSWVVPADLTVSEIGLNEGKLNFVPFKTGDVVPANTGVMVSAAEGGNYTVALTTNAGAHPEKVTNALHPSSEEMTGDNLFYRLTMHNGTQIGFWWGAENGAAFSIVANKAYLAVPKSAGVKADGMWFGNTETAIENLMSEKSNSVIYNVAGQRVSKATKGLYIKDGKKYLVK